MYERIYRLLQPKLDPECRVNILRSSKDPNLAEYLQRIKKRGSTHMEEDGNIFVKIDDAKNATKAPKINNLYIGIALDFSLVTNGPLISPLLARFSGQGEEMERSNSFFTRLKSGAILTSDECNGYLFSLPKGTWLEEFAHALQYLKYGNIIVTSSDDDQERREREREVAICLLDRADRLKLSDTDVRESQEILQNYGGQYEKN